MSLYPEARSNRIPRKGALKKCQKSQTSALTQQACATATITLLKEASANQQHLPLAALAISQ